jgi:uncharacterized coiled-coil protein SlyX
MEKEPLTDSQVKKQLRSWTDLRSSMVAGAFSFGVLFLGSWVQLNARISRVETQIEYMDRNIQELNTIKTKLDVLIGQNEVILEYYSKQHNSQKVKQKPLQTNLK